MANPCSQLARQLLCLSRGRLLRAPLGFTVMPRRPCLSVNPRRSLATSIHMQPVSARSPAAVRSFDRAVDAYVSQRGDSHGALSEALAVEPSMSAALALRLALRVSEGASDATLSNCTEALQRAVDTPEAAITPRERAIAAGERWPERLPSVSKA